MILVIGGLESVWSAHERHVYQVAPEPNATVRRSALRAHEKLLEAIEAGNAETAAQIARRHLDATQAFTMAAGESPRRRRRTGPRQLSSENHIDVWLRESSAARTPRRW